MKKKIFQSVQYLLFIVVLFIVGRTIIDNLGELQKYEVRFNVLPLLVAYLMHFIHFIGRSILWHYITMCNRVDIPFRKANSLWFYSQLGRYLPGKIMYPGLRLYTYKQENKSAGLVSFSIFIEYLAVILASVLVMIISLLFLPFDLEYEFRLIGLILAILLIVALHPSVLNIMLRVANRFLKTDYPPIDITFRKMVLLILLFVLDWLFLGLGVYFIVLTVYPVSPSYFIYIIGGYALATVMGMVAVFAPSGLGVREGFFIIALTRILPAGFASVISILARVWAMSSELFLIIIFSGDPLKKAIKKVGSSFQSSNKK